MKKIYILSEDVANRIAAGEVVERPASVVKELVENSIDAGARRVVVKIEGAGKDFISVQDDGEGMSRDDAITAFKRHATSKIRSSDDLHRLATLGFRGEALPSIASVSRLELTTCPAGSSEGTFIFFDAGAVADERSVGAPAGATIEVKDLFFNVPARRKFLKSDASEQKNIVETLTQLALVHFDIGFELKTGSRRLISLPPDQSRQERTNDLLGSSLKGGFFWADFEFEDYACVFAYASPDEARRNRANIRFFVNERPVVDKFLFRALMDGYGDCLVSGHYPSALLWLKIPSEQLDVNVHPAKREVRFQDERKIFRWVAGCVSEAVSRAPWTAGSAVSSNAFSYEDEINSATSRAAFYDSSRQAPASRPYVERARESLRSYSPRAAGTEFPRYSPQRLPSAFNPSVGNYPALDPSAASLVKSSAESELECNRPSGACVESRFGRLNFLGAFDSTYLIFEDRDSRELVLFDQHAAHERILYELFMEAFDSSTRSAQPFLFPASIECSAVEMASFDERQDDLKLMGFDVERFGPNSLAVSGAPAGLSAAAAEAAVRDFLGAGDLCSPADDQRQRIEAAAKKMACSAAVKARSKLLPSEAVELVKRLENLKNPSHCPHGRPLLIRISRQNLESMFQRK